jgi:hypothetical protein
MEPEPGYVALEKLGSEETESRSHDFGGRRLVRVDGGYIVLNYMKYRERDYTGAERQKRWRERKKNKSVTRDERNVTRDITQAEVEVEVEAEKSKSKSDDTRVREDVELAVREIASLHPKIKDAQNLSHEVGLAIAEAIARHGRDLVWAGTKNLAEAVVRWPKSEMRFIPAAPRFYRESLYKTDPQEWDRSNGNGKAQQRQDHNLAVRERVLREIEGSSGRTDGVS